MFDIFLYILCRWRWIYEPPPLSVFGWNGRRVSRWMQRLMDDLGGELGEDG